jgi:glutamine phosphoribosylpyrophosphate amidotransferase
MILGADERRALAMLAKAGRDGAAQAWLSAHGFDASTTAGLVSEGMATIAAEKVRIEDKMVAVAKVRITEAGQNALMAEG